MKCPNCLKEVESEFQHMGVFGEWGCYRAKGSKEDQND